MNEPRTLTEAIARISTKLGSLDWTDAVYNRVSIHDVKLAGQDRAQIKPMAFQPDGDYLDARPNDNLKSVLFFATTQPEKNDYNAASPTRYAINHIRRVFRPVVLYGWVNLAKLPDYNDGSGFPELIKLNLKSAVQSVSCVTAIGNYLDGQLSEVFKPFLVSDLDTKYDRFPFACFRLELTVFTIETRQ